MKTVFGTLMGVALAFSYTQTAQASALIAQPPTITTFQVSGTFTDAASLHGTLTINTTAGSVTGGDLFVGTTEFTILFNGGSSAPFDANNDYSWNGIVFHAPSDAEATLQLNLLLGQNVKSLVGYAGGALCGVNGFNCSDIFSYYDLGSDPFLASGNVSGAPEPASLLLVGAPLAFFAIRRKLSRNN